MPVQQRLIFGAVVQITTSVSMVSGTYMATVQLMGNETRLKALSCAQERPEPLARGDRERHALPPAPSSAIALFAFVFVSRPRIFVVPNTLLPSTARFGLPCRSRCPAGKCRSIVVAAPWVRVFRPDGDATAIPRMVRGGQR